MRLTDEHLSALHALGPHVHVVYASASMSAESVLAGIRGGEGMNVTIALLDPDIGELDRAMMLAAIGPLAVELAPATRLVAVDVAADADPDAVVAAARYLIGANGTTGQVLRVTA